MNKKQVIEYGREVLQLLQPFIQWGNLLSAVAEDELNTERGTLSLEKEAKARRVDKTVFAKYRRAECDVYGNSLTVGIALRIIHYYTDARGEFKDHGDGTTDEAIAHTFGHIDVKFVDDYLQEMNQDSAAMLKDICTFIDNITVEDFPQLSFFPENLFVQDITDGTDHWILQAYGENIEKIEEHFNEPPQGGVAIPIDPEKAAIAAQYYQLYSGISDIINRGVIALDLAYKIDKAPQEEHEAAAETLHKAIKRAVKRITKRNPPPGAEKLKFSFDDLHPDRDSGDNTQGGEIAGQQSFFPTSRPFELAPRHVLADVFRGRGMHTSDFDTNYSDPQLYMPHVIEDLTVTVPRESFSRLVDTLNDRADKLLTSIGVAYIEKKPPDGVIYIDLQDYCDKCGYSLESSNTAKQTKRRIKQDLEALRALKFEYHDKKGQFVSCQLIGDYGIPPRQKGSPYIFVQVGAVAGALMKQGQLTHYPREVYKLSGKAYNIGKKLCEHCFMDGNRAKGTTNIISVERLLNACGMEDLDDRIIGHWRTEIKEPIENAFDKLQQAGILQDWKYCRAKKKDLTDEEAEQIISHSYGEYMQLYITFTLSAEPDDTERLANKAKRIAAREEKEAAAHVKAAAKVIESQEKKQRKTRKKNV